MCKLSLAAFFEAPAIAYPGLLLKILTCENNNVNVIFGVLKLVWDTQIAVNIFLFQAGQFPTVSRIQNNELKDAKMLHITKS